MNLCNNAAILIVENDAAHLAHYAGMVSDFDAPVVSASSEEEALQALQQGDVALILMALAPPDGTGRAGADALLLQLRTGSTPVIFLGPEGPPFSFEQSRSGLVDWLELPLQPERLRAKVRIFLDLHRKTRQLAQLNADIDQAVERRLRARRGREGEYRLRADLLDLATEAIVVRSLKDGAIQFWNAGAEQLYGWSRDQVLGRDLHELLQTQFPASRAETEHALIATGSWQGKVSQRTSDGREIVLDCRKTLNRERDAVLEVNRDITLEIEAQRALRESERLAAMGRVAGMIAHEINNPLAAITNLFYLLQIHPSLDEQARGYVGAIENELERVSHITRQTLSFYRETRQPVAVQICEILDDVLELQMRPLQASGITVQKRYGAVSLVEGFPVELRQIFLNLVINAVQAMPQGGTLRLHVHDALDPVTGRRGPCVSVVDTGTGIRKEDAPHLFEPFFSTKAAKGTGLGLWIIKGILEKYHGRISCRSYRLGGRAFTCFRVFFTSGSSEPTVPPHTDLAATASPAVQAGDGDAPLSAALTS